MFQQPSQIIFVRLQVIFQTKKLSVRFQC